MPVVLTDHVDGDPIAWADIYANTSTILRTYLNNVQDGDIAAASIRREHLVRPVVSEFPNHHVTGAFQTVGSKSYGLRAESERISDSHWAARVEKLILFPQRHAGDTANQRFILPIGCSVDAWVGSVIDATCTFEYWTPFTAAPAIPTDYPDGAGGPANARRNGFFAIGYADRQTRTLNVLAESKQPAYPMGLSALEPLGSHQDMFYLHARHAIGAGRYDFFLVYDVSEVVMTLPHIASYQVAVSRVQFSYEVA